MAQFTKSHATERKPIPLSESHEPFAGFHYLGRRGIAAAFHPIDPFVTQQTTDFRTSVDERLPGAVLRRCRRLLGFR